MSVLAELLVEHFRALGGQFRLQDLKLLACLPLDGPDADEARELLPELKKRADEIVAIIAIERRDWVN